MKMDKIKIVITDDHQIIRDGIIAGFKFDKNFEVVGEASNETELQELLNTVKPDIIIMDINMPGSSGIKITESLSDKYKIIMFSAITDAETVVNALKAGAKGFLPKDTMRNEIKKAVVSVYNGEEYISEDVANELIVNYINGDKEIKVEPSGIEKLTKREIEIVANIAEGNTYKEIGEKLFISFRTVETHKTHIMQKLGLRNIAEVIKFAIKNKIIEI